MVKFAGMFPCSAFFPGFVQCVSSTACPSSLLIIRLMFLSCSLVLFPAMFFLHLTKSWFILSPHSYSFRGILSGHNACQCLLKLSSTCSFVFFLVISIKLIIKCGITQELFSCIRLTRTGGISKGLVHIQVYQTKSPLFQGLRVMVTPLF